MEWNWIVLEWHEEEITYRMRKTLDSDFSIQNIKKLKNHATMETDTSSDI